MSAAFGIRHALTKPVGCAPSGRLRYGGRSRSPNNPQARGPRESLRNHGHVGQRGRMGRVPGRNCFQYLPPCPVGTSCGGQLRAQAGRTARYLPRLWPQGGCTGQLAAHWRRAPLRDTPQQLAGEGASSGNRRHIASAAGGPRGQRGACARSHHGPFHLPAPPPLHATSPSSIRRHSYAQIRRRRSCHLRSPIRTTA